MAKSRYRQNVRNRAPGRWTFGVIATGAVIAIIWIAITLYTSVVTQD